MELDKLSLFGIAKKRLSWLTQRQEVLSQNVANSDTPKYRAKDLQEFNFRDLLSAKSMQVKMAVTSRTHLPGSPRAVRDFREVAERKPYETAPNGNSVVLEEQMGKVNETQIAHRLTIELYNKHLGMIRTAIGKGR